MKVHPLAGSPADPLSLENIPKLVTAYYTEIPDATIPEERVVFGTSGHRGSSLDKNFNERHILAIAQAICNYRSKQNISGPLFLGIDTHALSIPAYASVLEVLAANGVDVMIADNDDYTPTPVISHAILTYNRSQKKKGQADGIVITPSHNPPKYGGIKYNPPNGGPADEKITSWIESKANEFLSEEMSGIHRISFEKALKSPTTHRYNYSESYINDLENVVDMQLISDSQLSLCVDPLGGAGVHYWKKIANRYRLNLTILNEIVDPTFSFMTLDWDGQIRMDPSSSFAMHKLINLKDRFDVAFASDTDHDRHGIITRKSGLMPTNHFISVALNYLFQHRPLWSKQAGVGKTLVSSQMIDRISSKLNRHLYEVPVGFKWFVDGLLDGSLALVGEESAGMAFAKIDGSVWTTDKDGITPGLLAAEITAKTGVDISDLYLNLTKEFGTSYFERIDAKATREQKKILKTLTPEAISIKELAGEKINAVLTKAPGNNAPIGGVKVISNNGWFAARPSGTEDIYKIYAESFKSMDHLNAILVEAQSIISAAFDKHATLHR